MESKAKSRSRVDETGAGAGVGRAGVGAEYQSAGAETMMDIAQAEIAHLNLKHRYDLTVENADALRQQTVSLRENGVAATNTLVQNAASAAGQLIQAATQETIAKMAASTDAVHKTSRTSLFEVDKLENIDEVNTLVTILVSKVAEEVLKQKE